METSVLFLLWTFCILGAVWLVIKGDSNDD